MNLVEALAISAGGGLIGGVAKNFEQQQLAKKFEGVDWNTITYPEAVKKFGLEVAEKIMQQKFDQDFNQIRMNQEKRAADVAAPLITNELNKTKNYLQGNTMSSQSAEQFNLPQEYQKPTYSELPFTQPPSEEKITPEKIEPKYFEAAQGIIQSQQGQKEAELGIQTKEANLQIVKDQLNSIQALRDKYPYDKEAQDKINEIERAIKEQTNVDTFNQVKQDLLLEGVKSGKFDITGKPIKPEKPEKPKEKKLSLIAQQKIKTLESKIQAVQNKPENYGFASDGMVDNVKLNNYIETLQKQIEDIINKDTGSSGKKIITQDEYNLLIKKGHKPEEITKMYEVR